jgi:hypothetical protein
MLALEIAVTESVEDKLFAEQRSLFRFDYEDAMLAADIVDELDSKR